MEKKTPNRQNHPPKSPWFSGLMLVFLFFAGYLILGEFLNNDSDTEKIAISKLRQEYLAENLEKVTIKSGEVEAITKEGKKLFAYKLPNEKAVDLGFNSKEVKTPVEVIDIESGQFWSEFLFSFFPIILIISLMIFMMKKAGGSSGLGFGMSKAKLFTRENSKTRFKDVAGVEEAKEELKEVVDFLKFPKKYVKMGAKIPRGVLLVGEPGTGKTLIARAVAGEACVPFFTISGSEFIEMFVGVGASRVRDLFEKAKKVAPAIIFIDEIDAIGKQRGPGFGGGHDEREQTLNQILTEMDGFENTTHVIVIAATNRPDVLDKALLRPGRFDRRVVIDKPDKEARTEILKVHSKNKPLSSNVVLEEVAKKTPGFSGAELESVMNEAAIFAARRNKKTITQNILFESVEKVLMGPEKKSRKVIEKEKKITAYHEVGHALISHKLDECDPVHKISIVARGLAGGVTWFLPDEEIRMYSKKKFLAEIVSLLGGRIAEEVKFGIDEVTTGASNDLERASKIARLMVTKYGMSSLGLSVLEEEKGVYSGKQSVTDKYYSEDTAKKIDLEVEKILKDSYNLGKKILIDNLEIFERISEDLIKKEVISSSEFKQYFD
jgi:cell division protease FtsH